MIDLALNDDGDLLVENFDMAIVSGVDQVKQSLIIRLKFFINDWFLDINAGLPYYEEFFIKSPNQIRIESLLVNEILTTRGVQQLLSFESEFDSDLRKFIVNFKVLIEEIETEIEVSLP